MIRVRNIVAQVVGVEESRLPLDASSANVPSWDSFNTVLIMSALEKQFSLDFSVEDMTYMTSLSDIQQTLEKHGVTLT